MSTNEDIKTIADFYGEENQIDKTIEEMAELTQALIKYKHSDDDLFKEQIIEEITDVKIMIEQLEYLLKITDEALISARMYKLSRTLSAINREEKWKR